MHTFLERVWRKMFWMLLGDTVAKVCASPRNLTRFTRSFLLMRRWGLETRLIQRAGGWSICKASLGPQRLRYCCTRWCWVNRSGDMAWPNTCSISQAFPLHTVHNQRLKAWKRCIHWLTPSVHWFILSICTSTCWRGEYLKRKNKESHSMSVWKLTRPKNAELERLNLAINSINIKVSLSNSTLASYPGRSLFSFNELLGYEANKSNHQ